ncbi:MAG TPA: hypothetical protein VJ464_11420 [Blastocatellia bacterium]|nr:hypothetical protein [Blastocatellia bacterium]
MINWLLQDEFWHSLRLRYLPSQISLEDRIHVRVPLSAFKSYIPTTPIWNSDEFDEPGPSMRWYGTSDDIPFFITHYEKGDESLTTISTLIPISYKEKYKWSILEQLVDLPAPILRRISWLCGHKEGATTSLYFKDSLGIISEVYRAATDEEAKELLQFLLRLGTDYEYFLGKPENLALDWIVKRNKENKDLIVGRYSLRESAERVARVMSISDRSIYYVIPAEDALSYQRTFFEGKIIEPTA